MRQIRGSLFPKKRRIQGADFGEIRFRSLGDQGQAGGRGDGHLFINQGRMILDIGKTVFLRLFGNGHGGQKHGDVFFGLLLQVAMIGDFPKIIALGLFHGGQHSALSGIIACRSEVPVVEHAMEGFQIFGCRQGGFFRIAAFIHPLVDAQAEAFRRLADKLPDAAGLGSGKGGGVVPALDEGEVEQALPEGSFPERSFSSSLHRPESGPGIGRRRSRPGPGKKR